MNLEQLRKQHPRLIYQNYTLEIGNQDVRIGFQFLLEPDIQFSPEVVIPIDRIPAREELDNFVFHLGLVELISYWKVACPPEIAIAAGWLSEEQIKWWYDLFIHGLGEFFYQNKIDFTAPNFLKIQVIGESAIAPYSSKKSLSGDLMLVGGGKDSCVTLEVLKESPRRKGTFVLNPTRASLDSIKIAGYDPPLTVKRTIDPKLIELNRSGYLNGHTPFSAYLAFLGTLIAELHGYETVIASNENSANEQNTIFHQLKVNHQYSKSVRFEQRFREYCDRYLTPRVRYFSFLRPLFDLQISGIFSQFSTQHLSFRSCNVNQRKDSWCKKCPKCAFVYLSLFPFLSYEQVLNIFGEDLYFRSEIAAAIAELSGVEKHKPFECVGTIEESQLAVALSIEKYQKMERPIPPILLEVAEKANLKENEIISDLRKQLNQQWNDNNFLPSEHEQLLKKALSSLSSEFLNR